MIEIDPRILEIVDTILVEFTEVKKELLGWLQRLAEEAGNGLEPILDPRLLNNIHIHLPGGYVWNERFMVCPDEHSFQKGDQRVSARQFVSDVEEVMAAIEIPVGYDDYRSRYKDNATLLQLRLTDLKIYCQLRARGYVHKELIG